MPSPVPAPIAVGLTVGPSRPFEVTDAVLDPLDACLSAVDGVPTGPATALSSVSALPTLPAVLALADAAGDGGPSGVLRAAVAGRPGVGVVHGDTRIEAVRPVRVGDRLVFTSTVESVRSMGGATVLAVGTSVVAVGTSVAVLGASGVPSDDADPVASIRSTFVVTAPTAVVTR